MPIPKKRTKKDRVITNLLPVVEVWSSRKWVPDPVYNALVKAKPSPFGGSREQTMPVSGKRRGVDFWRYELGPKSKSKVIALQKLARWATKHKSLIRAAKKAGCKCSARIEVYPRHWLYNLPLSFKDLDKIQTAGLEFVVVWHATMDD